VLIGYLLEVALGITLRMLDSILARCRQIPTLESIGDTQYLLDPAR
jgi:hypothetical protein